MRAVALHPRDISRLQLPGGPALAFNITAQVQSGQGYNQVWTSMMVLWHHSAGLQLKFRGASPEFHIEDVLGPAVQDVQAALFASMYSPLRRGRWAGFFILHQFDSHIAEGLVGKIPGDVSKTAGGETRLAILQLELGRRLAGYVVLHL